MIEISGDILEGGGQILRNSISLATVANKSIRISNIRAKRSKPGLRAQHMNAINAIAKIADAKVSGLTLGSNEIFFNPKSIKGGSFRIDIGTAGSSSLVLQALMPVVAYSSNNVDIEIKGGTNTINAPPIEYTQKVLLPIISKMGFKGFIDLRRRGFYPKGQGIINARFEPVKKINPIQLTEFGEVATIYGISHSSNLPPHIAERMAKSASIVLAEKGYSNVNIKIEVLRSGDTKCALDSGCELILLAELSSGSIIGTNLLGKIGKSAERVGIEAAENLLAQLKKVAPVDKYLADQLIPYMSIADGRSKIMTTELTLHTLTCIEVSKRILNIDFRVKGEQGELASIECDGIGLKNTI
jgi:RNA 3'-terminal phosphate cyclase (ATP)